MHIFYLVITVVAALANGYAASLNFAGAESVRIVAERVRVSQQWMIPLGILLAAGAGGLLVGLAVPLLGAAAAAGLVLYFICALGAHVRAHDRGVGGAVSFLVLAGASLAATLTYHDLHHW
jgi:DoxX-like protein